MLERRQRTNLVHTEGGIRRLDVRGIGEWLVGELESLSAHRPSVLVPVAHGAAVALIQGEQLGAEPLDYEQALPPDVLAAYRAERDAFALTGSPALPEGLNLGAQLFWLERLEAEAMRRSTLVPWAQYWSWFLSGVAVSEVTSLGCHTDLWCPARAGFSRMAQRHGWDRRFAPLARADATLGTLRPALAQATRLAPSTRVLCGLHDSNAALLAARGFAELAGRDATVLSTGTWFIAMRSPAGAPVGGDARELPEERDCLLNVDIDGRAVPSARFMGGRELETLLGADALRLDAAAEQSAMLEALPRLLEQQAFALPSFRPGTGPYAKGQGRWQNEPGDRAGRCAAAALYAALVADASLELIGSRDTLLVEGRFARCEIFVRALASLRRGTRVFTAEVHDDVPLGALRLVHPGLAPANRLMAVQPLAVELSPARERWRQLAEAA